MAAPSTGRSLSSPAQSGCAATSGGDDGSRSRAQPQPRPSRRHGKPGRPHRQERAAGPPARTAATATRVRNPRAALPAFAAVRQSPRATSPRYRAGHGAGRRIPASYPFGRMSRMSAAQGRGDPGVAPPPRLLPLAGDAVVIAVQSRAISGLALIERGGTGLSGLRAIAIVGALGRLLGCGGLLGIRGSAITAASSAGILPARRVLLRLRGGGLGRALLLRGRRRRSRAVDDGGHGRGGVDDRGHRRRRIDHSRLRRGSGLRSRGGTRIAGRAGGADADAKSESQNERQRSANQSAAPGRRPRRTRGSGIRGVGGCGRERGRHRRVHGSLGEDKE